MACDSDIAPEEIGLLKTVAAETALFDGMEIEPILNGYVADINRNGKAFLRKYLSELAETEWTEEEELRIVDLAIRMIEADQRVEYAEVKFFKKLRARLSVPDERILERHPDKELFLLPDVNVADDPVWSDDVAFADISWGGSLDVKIQ